MIKEDIVSFETAKLLKEKGFSENTICKYADIGGITEKWYDDYRERVLRFDWGEGYLIEPPIEPKEQYEIIGNTIMKWLREECKIHIQIWILEEKGYWFDIEKILNVRYKHKSLYSSGLDDIHFETYEEAADAAIKYYLDNLIESLNNKL